MKSLEQLRRQVSVIPCRFAERGGAAQIPNVSDSGLSIAGGLPNSYAVPPDENGQWILRGDVNSLGCLASDELFFRQAGGVHTFEEDSLWDAGIETYVSAITSNDTVPRTYVRNASFDVPASSAAIQSYYGWTDSGDVVFTTSQSPSVNSSLFSIMTSERYVPDPEGRKVSAYTPEDDSDPGNVIQATITVGSAVCTRESQSDVTRGGVTLFYAWSGGFFTQEESASVVGQPVYINDGTGIVASPTGAVISAVTRDYVGGGYPKDAVLEYAVKPWSLKVMSVVEGTKVNFIDDETALLTEKNWRLVEPEKDFDADVAVCQVDWSGMAANAGRFYRYSENGEPPYGYFAKDGGANLISVKSGVSSVVIALKDLEEVTGY